MNFLISFVLVEVGKFTKNVVKRKRLNIKRTLFFLLLIYVIVIIDATIIKNTTNKIQYMLFTKEITIKAKITNTRITYKSESNISKSIF